MHETVREYMTPNPVTLDSTCSITDAAKAMRTSDIGDVIVMSDGKLSGILTDRDIVVRALAGTDMAGVDTKIADICSRDVYTLSPDDDVDRAIDLMRQNKVRRLPVVEDGKPVGIVSLGDLAERRDPRSVLAAISHSQPNN